MSAPPATLSVPANELLASALINGGLGGGDHFFGLALGAQWLQEDSAAVSLTIANSVLAVRPVQGAGISSVVRPFAPGGAFRVEARFLLGIQSAGQAGLVVRDNTVGESAGQDVLVFFDYTSGAAQFFSGNAGVYNQSGGNLVIGNQAASAWFYLAIERAGNNWKAYYSRDRAFWLQVGNTLNKAQAVAKMGMRCSQVGGWASADFIDVVA